MTRENKTLLIRIWGAIAVFFAICFIFTINAFADGEVKSERKDILRALNRLSSALYIMYLEVLAEGGES